MSEPLPDKTSDAIADFMRREKLGPGFAETVQRIYRPLAARIRTLTSARPAMSSEFAAPRAAANRPVQACCDFCWKGRASAIAALSIDDLYFPKEAREKLAEDVHPLLATRGPPGTHDVALGERLLDTLGGPGHGHSPVRQIARHAQRSLGMGAISGSGRYHFVRRLVRRRQARAARSAGRSRSTIWKEIPIRTAGGAVMSMMRWRDRTSICSAADRISRISEGAVIRSGRGLAQGAGSQAARPGRQRIKPHDRCPDRSFRAILREVDAFHADRNAVTRGCIGDAGCEPPGPGLRSSRRLIGLPDFSAICQFPPQPMRIAAEDVNRQALHQGIPNRGTS